MLAVNILRLTNIFVAYYLVILIDYAVAHTLPFVSPLIVIVRAIWIDFVVDVVESDYDSDCVIVIVTVVDWSMACHALAVVIDCEYAIVIVIVGVDRSVMLAIVGVVARKAKKRNATGKANCSEMTNELRDERDEHELRRDRRQRRTRYKGKNRGVTKEKDSDENGQTRSEQFVTIFLPVCVDSDHFLLNECR